MPRTHAISGGGTRVFTAAEEADFDARAVTEAEAAGDRKRIQAEQYRDRIAHSACASSLNGNWAIRVSSGQRLFLGTVAAVLEKRARAGQSPVFPARGVDLEALHKSRGTSITQNVNEAQYNTTIDDIAAFDEAWQDAFGAVLDQINRLGTDYAAIDAIDFVTYPGSAAQQTADGTAHPWPDFWED